MIDCYPPIPVEVTAGAHHAPAPAGSGGPLPRYVTQFITAKAPIDNVMLRSQYATQSLLVGSHSPRNLPGTAKLPGNVLVAREEVRDTDGIEAEAARLVQRRATLIAVRNATTDTSIELLARLDMLNARMRDQSPRVTDQHITSLESSAALVDRVAERRRLRAARRAAGA